MNCQHHTSESCRANACEDSPVIKEHEYEDRFLCSKTQFYHGVFII